MAELKAEIRLPTAKEIGDDFRAVRDKYLASGGVQLRSAVQARIQSSGMHLRTGRVVGWQTLYPRKGYAAVRPEASASGASSPGAITGYLERGHGIRRPSGAAKHYTPRIRTAFVRGFGFYAASQADAERITAEIAARAAAEVAEKLSRR